VWAKNIENPDFIELLYVFIFIENKYGPKIFKILTLFVFCVGAYSQTLKSLGNTQ
jgi:hypothetical protein